MFSISIPVELNDNKYPEHKIAWEKYQKYSHNKHAEY